MIVCVNARLLAAVPAALAALVLCAAAPASAAKLCAYTIPAAMIDRVESANARVGGMFRFKTTEEATLADGTFVAVGTAGFGLIRSASAAGRHSHDGMLALEPRYLVVLEPHGAVKRIDVTMTPTLPVTYSPSELLINKAASRVPLPVPGLVMTGVNTIRWGRNITLGPGFTFSVVPTGDLSKGPIC